MLSYILDSGTILSIFNVFTIYHTCNQSDVSTKLKLLYLLIKQINQESKKLKSFPKTPEIEIRNERKTSEN